MSSWHGEMRINSSAHNKATKVFEKKSFTLQVYLSFEALCDITMQIQWMETFKGLKEYKKYEMSMHLLCGG